MEFCITFIIDFKSDKKYNSSVDYEKGGKVMAKMGRPKSEDPCEHKVTVKFREAQYSMLVDYAKNHNLTISQLIRLIVEDYFKQDIDQK